MADKKKRLQRDVSTLDQWIEVAAHDGETVTETYPSNEVLKEKLARMTPVPDLVYRRFHFRGGVPEEYNWVQPSDQQRELGGLCIQRMTVDEWIKLSIAEGNSAGGHLLPCFDPRPRPKIRGECECKACVANRERLERSGLEVL